MCTHTPLLNYYSYPLQHTYPRYFERLISLMASHFYLLSHVLFKNNIPFQEFSLLPSRWCSELCPPGLSAVRAFGEKMLGFLELRMSLGSVHKWMTAWLDTTVRVVPRSLENTQNVNPVIFLQLTGVENLPLQDLPLAWKIVSEEVQMFWWFSLISFN